jgi:hypothetical protein
MIKNGAEFIHLATVAVSLSPLPTASPLQAIHRNTLRKLRWRWAPSHPSPSIWKASEASFLERKMKMKNRRGIDKEKRRYAAYNKN